MQTRLHFRGLPADNWAEKAPCARQVGAHADARPDAVLRLQAKSTSPRVLTLFRWWNIKSELHAQLYNEGVAYSVEALRRPPLPQWPRA